MTTDETLEYIKNEIATWTVPTVSDNRMVFCIHDICRLTKDALDHRLKELKSTFTESVVYTKPQIVVRDGPYVCCNEMNDKFSVSIKSNERSDNSTSNTEVYQKVVAYLKGYERGKRIDPSDVTSNQLVWSINEDSPRISVAALLEVGLEIDEFVSTICEKLRKTFLVKDYDYFDYVGFRLLHGPYIENNDFDEYFKISVLAEKVIDTEGKS